jgi:hypothetical protein
MEQFLEQFMAPFTIRSTSINWVALAPGVRTVLYICFLIAFVVTAIRLLSLKNPFSTALKKSLVFSFLLSGLLYAVHADIGWFGRVVQDYGVLGSRTTDEKLQATEGQLYDFIRAAKRVLPETYVMYSSDSYLALRSEYFFLPARKRENAEVIVVAGDGEAHYDPSTRIFTRGNVRISNVEPILLYASNAFVVKKR